MQQQTEQLDPSIVALTKAIGHQESGGKYDLVGDNGHSKGAYQWNNAKPLQKGQIPKNFALYAHDVGADGNDFSPENQDRVAYKTVEKWGKEGLTPAQIASKWNSGGPDNYKTAKPGYNAEQGVHYDVKAYVDNVAKYYEEYRGGNVSQGGSASQQKNGLTKDTIVSTPEASAVQSDRQQKIQEGEPVSVNPEKTDPSLIGSLIRGVAKPFAKAATSVVNIEQLARGKEPTQPFSGKYLGHVGAVGEGFDSTQGLTKKNVGALADATKTGVSIGATIAGANSAKGLIGQIIGPKKALENPIIVKLLKLGGDETLENLPKEFANIRLTNALNKLPVSEAGGKTEQLILKAIKELNPSIIEKQSLLKNLAQKGFDAVKLYALSKLLGEKIGGVVHQNTK